MDRDLTDFAASNRTSEAGPRTQTPGDRVRELEAGQ